MSICVSSRVSFEKTLSLYKQDTAALQKNTGLNASLGWSNLPEGLSHKILGILGHSHDFLNFVLTCRAWSTVFLKDGLLDLSFYPLLKDSQLIALMLILKEKTASTPLALHIHTVNLSGCNLLTKKSISALQSCPLITLNLYGCSLDYRCMNRLKCLTQLKHLRLDKFYRDRCYTSLDTVSPEELNPLHGLHLETLSLGQGRRVSLPKELTSPQQSLHLEILSLSKRRLSLPKELTSPPTPIRSSD